MLLTPEILRSADRNHGLVTLAAWLASGRSRASFYRAVDHGTLVDILPTVAALAGRPLGPLQRIAAGVLHFGPGVVGSHRSATYLWHGPVTGDRPVDLLCTGPTRRTTRPGYVLHRATGKVPTRLRHQVRVTAPLPTLLHLGAVCAREIVLDALEAFLVARHVTLEDAERFLARTRRSGRDGSAALAWAVGEATAGLRQPDSQLESVAARIFRRAGLTSWVFHDIVEGYEVDFVFAAERLVVEVDGWASHGAKKRLWEDDRDKDLFLASKGWAVLRLTWRMMNEDPAKAISRVRAVLALRRPAE